MSTYSIELKKYELGKSLDPIFKLITKRLLVLSNNMSEQLGVGLRTKLETFDKEKNGKKVTTGYNIKIFNFPEEFAKENKLNTMKPINRTLKHNFRAMLLEKQSNTFEVKRMKIVHIKFEKVPDTNKDIIIDYLSSYALYKEWIQKHQLKIIKDKDGMYLRGTIKRVNEVVTLLKDVIKKLNNSPEHSYTFKERKFKKRKRKEKYTLELKDEEFGYEEKYNIQVYKITYQKSVPLKL